MTKAEIINEMGRLIDERQGHDVMSLESDAIQAKIDALYDTLYSLPEVVEAERAEAQAFNQAYLNTMARFG